MSALKPELHSVVGPKPALSAQDVQRSLRAEVEHAIYETDARIAALEKEIEVAVKDRGALAQHRDSLQVWLNDNAI